MGSRSHFSGSSRRARKSNSDMPRQPQRGLGVAQLEKIRLHNQLAAAGGFIPSLHSPPLQYSHLPKEANVRVVEKEYPSPPFTSNASSPSSLFGLPPNYMMGFGDHAERRTTTGYNHEPQSSANYYRRPTPTVTLALLNQPMEDWVHKERRQEYFNLGANSQILNSSDAHEIDLDLRLSL